MGARHKMALTLLTVMAAAALGLACADPTPATTASAPSEVSDAILTTTIGSQTLNLLVNITGKWWTYVRETIDSPYQIIEVDITRKTLEEIAVYEQSWLLRNNSRNETNQDPSDSINWQNVNFILQMKLENNDSFSFLMEVLSDPFHLRSINMNWRTVSYKVKITEGKLTFREVSRPDEELNFYKTLPDLVTFARCENFDSFDASEALNHNYLVGTWTSNRELSGLFLNLRVTTKTAEEISAYRVDLRNTTVKEADIDWTKVRLQAELFSTGNEVRVLGLIEELDKPGSVRVIPLKETWDDYGSTEVENWFTSQNVLTKRVDWFLAVRNCNNARQKAFFSRRPQIKTRKVLRKGSKTHSFMKHLTKAL